MKFRQYLWARNLTIKEFALTMRYDPGYLGQVMNGKKMPGRKLSEDIESATNGEITIEDIIQTMNARKEHSESELLTV